RPRTALRAYSRLTILATEARRPSAAVSQEHTREWASRCGGGGVRASHTRVANNIFLSHAFLNLRFFRLLRLVMSYRSNVSQSCITHATHQLQLSPSFTPEGERQLIGRQCQHLRQVAHQDLFGQPLHRKPDWLVRPGRAADPFPRLPLKGNRHLATGKLPTEIVPVTPQRPLALWIGLPKPSTTGQILPDPPQIEQLSFPLRTIPAPRVIRRGIGRQRWLSQGPRGQERIQHLAALIQP